MVDRSQHKPLFRTFLALSLSPDPVDDRQRSKDRCGPCVPSATRSLLEEAPDTGRTGEQIRAGFQ